MIKSISKTILISAALFLALLQTDCGSTYPDEDVFHKLYPGILNFYYFTNIAYQASSGTLPPELIGSSEKNRFLFLVDERYDIYYVEGFSKNFKDYDNRWYLQIDQFTNNHLDYKETNFGNNIHLYYYSHGGKPIPYNKGSIMVSQAGPRNWQVEIEVEAGNNPKYPKGAVHRLASYNNGSFSLIK